MLNRQSAIQLTKSHDCTSSMAEQPVSPCNMGRFALQYGPFRTLKRTVSHCDTNRLASQKRPFRTTLQFLCKNRKAS